MPSLPREKSVEDLDTSEAAAYLADMAGSLAVMARQHGFEALAYIFDMAHEEARGNSGSSDGARAPR